jgi:aspartyl-tRNA(Asn)/glutamyl-tRNA(Gln) amidotransferase subunit B
VRPAGSDKLGTRCEIKNLNSFRFLERAIDYEVRRQIDLIEDGGRVVQETRLYDPDRDETRPMRSKEDAHDYRYFPDPDLLPLEISRQWLEEVKASLPELPRAKRERFVSGYAITPYDAGVLTGSRELADYFEAAAQGAGGQVGKLAANWIAGSLSAKLNEEALDIADSKVTAPQLRRLVERIADGTLSGKIAKDVFDAMWSGEAAGNDAADTIIEARGLRQISDSGALEKIADEVIVANAQQVADYRGGKERAFNSLVGQVMKATKGKANPQQVTDILKRKLTG